MPRRLHIQLAYAPRQYTRQYKGYLRFLPGRAAIMRIAPSMRRARVSGFFAPSMATRAVYSRTPVKIFKRPRWFCSISPSSGSPNTSAGRKAARTCSTFRLTFCGCLTSADSNRSLEEVRRRVRKRILRTKRCYLTGPPTRIQTADRSGSGANICRRALVMNTGTPCSR